jgi:hypothetical protein
MLENYCNINEKYKNDMKMFWKLFRLDSEGARTHPSLSTHIALIILAKKHDIRADMVFEIQISEGYIFRYRKKMSVTYMVLPAPYRLPYRTFKSVLLAVTELCDNKMPANLSIHRLIGRHVISEPALEACNLAFCKERQRWMAPIAEMVSGLTLVTFSK